MSKSESRQKDKLIQLRCTEAEAAILKEKAVAAGISTSDLLRRSALNRKIMIRSDIRMMSELQRLGGLQKHLYNQMQDSMSTELSKQFSEVLGEIKKAINAIDLTPKVVGK
ncbi:ribbon-helix-helix protein, CopG family (plasmid) [Pseudomonas yamanorum]|nr:ribbon-helix-helix protein, CopG family [Pseudomonas yamanorum]QLG96748.1 ribbon-helix-helix protein, CopG family [Pseudomonas yamanorum]